MHILHVKEPLIVFTPVGAPMILPDEAPQQLEAIRDRLRDVYVPDQAVQVEYRTVEGSVSDEILRTANEIGANLIVLGTHGRSGLARLLMGSVAETVMHQSRVPVLALRSPKHLANTGATADVAAAN
jgi:nucleotide-binding universal stress UspA family protein